MKILFVTSKAPEFYQGMFFGEKRFPIGIGYLISVLKQAGHEVDLLDRYLLGDVWNGNKKYDLVGIYSSTPCFEDTKNIINKFLGKAKLMIGGPHTSLYLDSIPESVDVICQCEGEKCVLDVVEGNIDKSVIRYPRMTSKELDSLPSPPFDLFMKLPYTLSVPWFKETPVFNFNSSRGCSYNCSFCSVREIWGKKVALMSPERIIEDIEKCIKDFGMKGVYFREDNFTISKARVRKFCELLLRKDLEIKWICESRCDTVDERLVVLMSRAGCKAMYVGFESGSDKMLKIYNKGITVDDSRRFAAWAHKAGIAVVASMIFNHPEETDVDRTLSREFLQDIKPETAWMNRWREKYLIP